VLDHTEVVPLLVTLKSGAEIPCEGSFEAFASFMLASGAELEEIEKANPQVAALLELGLIPFEGAYIVRSEIASVSLDPEGEDDDDEDDEDEDAPGPINGGDFRTLAQQAAQQAGQNST